jgi:hypothetical protein
VVDLGQPGNYVDAIGLARGLNQIDIASLLERFKENPDQTRDDVRMELGVFKKELASGIFALVCFHSEDLLKSQRNISDPTERFFMITRKLPMELQMIICHRVIDSPLDLVSVKDSDLALKALACHYIHCS